MIILCGGMAHGTAQRAALLGSARCDWLNKALKLN